MRRGRIPLSHCGGGVISILAHIHVGICGLCRTAKMMCHSEMGIGS